MASYLCLGAPAWTFSPSEETFWDQLYEIVYMGQQKSATWFERQDGLVGGKQLRRRIEEWREASLRALAV